MSACCDGHVLCDKCQAIKNETMQRANNQHYRARRAPRGESVAAMMARLQEER